MVRVSGWPAACAAALAAFSIADASSVAAADLSVKITDPAGKPVRDAVVTFSPSGGAVIPAEVKGASYVMAQKHITFTPFVLAVPQGATVSFPNRDRVNHHVYSFSPAQPFQLPLYGSGQTRSVKFDHAGTIALGCNIHDSMSAYIRVVDTPYFATTGDDGKVVLKDVPAGSGQLAVWQPLMEGGSHEMSRSFTMGAADAAQSFAVRVHAQAPMAGMY
jgi:plastocyanin